MFEVSGENSLLIQLIEKRAINNVDRIIAVSKFTKDQIIKFYKKNPLNIEIIYHGMEEYSKNLHIDPENFKNKYNLPNKKMILFVGRINDSRKGLEPLLMELKPVLNEIDAVMVVIGSGNQTKYLELSKKLNITKNIFFLGFVDDNDLNAFYKVCDVYICPSKLEGFGLTVLEAITNGAPVIAFKEGAIPELIQDGKNGLLVEDDDFKLFAITIGLLLKDKHLRDKIKRNNIAYESRNWIKTAQETQQLYISLIGVNEVE